MLDALRESVADEWKDEGHREDMEKGINRCQSTETEESEHETHGETW